jgi:hypothetical protein
MKKALLGILFFVPLFASASTLTNTQISAIIGLLQAFGASSDTIAIVQSDLNPSIGATIMSTPQTIMTGAIVVQSPKMTPFNVYQAIWEQSLSDIYYWGNKSLTSVSISELPNVTFPIARTVDTNDCIWIHDTIRGSNVPTTEGPVKMCGGTVHRFAPSETVPAGTYTLNLTSVDGDTYSTTISVY